MKKLSFLIFMLNFLFITPIIYAQENVRVKCNSFTMNVPSTNVRCIQIDGNIPLPEGASSSDLANAQIASSSIYFSDYENIRSEISPQVTFYLIDDMTKTSFSLLDIAIKLTDDIANLSGGFTNITDIYKDSSFMPYQEKERSLYLLPEFLTFQNVSGIRTVIGFDDSIKASAQESNLYYSFQGISTDGRYYISAVFPLMSQDLHGKGVSDINSIEAANFQPSLNQLDYFVKSIVIE